MVSLSSYRRNYLIFQRFRYSPHELNAAEYDFEIGSTHAVIDTLKLDREARTDCV